ncbi:MAG: FAD-dependent oxidoreductase [Bacteroidota bacterium]
MDRKEFVRLCSLLGIGLAVPGGVLAGGARGKSSFKGKVIIIGAGAAGMTAGYLLQQQGIEFEILEASAAYGGRMKRTTEFADFSIPLGAEWLHVKRGIFDEIVNDPSVPITVATTRYNARTDDYWYNGKTKQLGVLGMTKDQKFINATWFDFFEQYILPSVADRISYNTVVSSIDHSGAQVVIGTNRNEHRADRVIVTVPVKLLQQGAVTFTPALPEKKQAAIKEVKVWDGCKAFIEFSEKFYPTFTAFDVEPRKSGEKMYYDASYAQNTTHHILGLFAVGSGAAPYLKRSRDALIQYILAELDGIFNGRASATYVKHMFQNWNEEPFARGAYVHNHESWRRVRTLGKPVGDKLLFAGTAYTDGTDWGSVHTAARSAIRAVETLTE